MTPGPPALALYKSPLPPHTDPTPPLNASTAIPARDGRPAPNSGAIEFLRDWAIFVREAISSPRDVGALIPSSRSLARRMARLVEPADRGLVVELGAGTGVVTEALLERGVPPHHLIALERSAALADLLRSRFPGVRVICGDAADLRLLLRHAKAVPASAPVQVVSSLPLRSLPPDKVHAIIREIATVVKDGGHWIQYTYALRKREEPLGFVRREFTRVWQNVPPARIDVYAPAPRA